MKNFCIFFFEKSANSTTIDNNAWTNCVVRFQEESKERQEEVILPSELNTCL